MKNILLAVVSQEMSWMMWPVGVFDLLVIAAIIWLVFIDNKKKKKEPPE